jgi:hypothetical protein
VYKNPDPQGGGERTFFLLQQSQALVRHLYPLISLPYLPIKGMRFTNKLTQPTKQPTDNYN